jgi:predicted metalloprotease with PDZ domain
MKTNGFVGWRLASLLVSGALSFIGGRAVLAQANAPPAVPSRGTVAPATPGAALPPAQPDRTATLPPASNSREGADAAATELNRTRPRSGIGIQFNQDTQNGLTVGQVQESSTAAEAGFLPGDQILTVDGQSFNSPRQLQAYLGGQYGRTLPVIVRRDGRQFNLQLPVNAPTEGVAWLGVYLNDNRENERGATVAQVYPTGPAARAGLHTGDIIQQINGQAVASSADLIATIEEMRPGTKAELSLLRNNEPTQLTAILGSRDSFVFRGQNNEPMNGGRGSTFFDSDDDYNIPPYTMELEHNRRVAEQHQRIENEIAKLREEVRQLREALRR